MKVSYTAAAYLAALSSLTAALPQSLLPPDFKPAPEEILPPVDVSETDAPTIEPRQNRIIAYLYRDSDFRGEERSIGTFPGQCGNMPADFNDVISSLVSPYGNCEFWTNGGCGGARLYVTKNNGFPLMPNGFNDAISSMRCS